MFSKYEYNNWIMDTLYKGWNTNLFLLNLPLLNYMKFLSFQENMTAQETAQPWCPKYVVVGWFVIYVCAA
jgi:hypothetical protein